MPSPFLIMVMPKPHNNHSFWKDSSFHSQSCVQDLAPPILLLALVLGLLLPIGILLSFVDLLSLGCVRVFATPQTAARQASLFFTNSQRLLKLMFIESRGELGSPNTEGAASIAYG